MTTTLTNQLSPDQKTELDEELKRYGIRLVRADSFEVNGYRYTNARDAIAEAKRHSGQAS